LHLRPRGQPDGRPEPVREQDAPRAGHARDRPGPAGRLADGRRPEPDDRPDLPPRRSARGRRRRRVGPPVRLRSPGSRLQRRPQGVHLGRPRRYRQHQRRRARRVLHRLHGEPRYRLRLLALVGVPRLPDPDLRPHLPAHRHPRPAAGRPGMIGLRARWRLFRARARTFSEHHRSASILITMSIAAVFLVVLPRIPPFSAIQSENPWYDAFANAGVYVLLAMGLNVVVGLAGLLDLGYAAFFAIGSYTYAYSNSPFSGLDLPFFPMLFVGAAVAAVFGIALG